MYVSCGMHIRLNFEKRWDIDVCSTVELELDMEMEMTIVAAFVPLVVASRTGCDAVEAYMRPVPHTKSQVVAALLPLVYLDVFLLYKNIQIHVA